MAKKGKNEAVETVEVEAAPEVVEAVGVEAHLEEDRRGEIRREEVHRGEVHPEAEREGEGEEGSRSMIARNGIRLDRHQITSSQRRPQFELSFNRHFPLEVTRHSFLSPFHPRHHRPSHPLFSHDSHGARPTPYFGSCEGEVGQDLLGPLPEVWDSDRIFHQAPTRFLPTCDMPIGDENTEPISYLWRCPLFFSPVQLPVDRCTLTPTRLSAVPRTASLGLYAGTELDELVPRLSGLGNLPLFGHSLSIFGVPR